MAEVTWIKLNIGMFDNKKIKQIRKMPGGNDMVLFWVMLLTVAGKSNSQGYILFTENIPYNPEMLANEFDMELNIVKMALEVFSKFNMITTFDETIVISGWSEYQNAEGLEKIKEREQARFRKQKQREKEKALTAPAQEELCADGSEKCDMSRDSHSDITVTPSSSYIYKEEENKEVREKKEEDILPQTYELNSYFEMLSKRIGVLASHLYELNDLVKLYPYDWIKEAMEIAVEKNAKSVAYIDKILKNWVNEGKADKKKSEEPQSAGWGHLKKFS